MISKRRLFFKSSSILLSLILIFVLSACGGKSTNDASEDSSATNTTLPTSSTNTNNAPVQKSDVDLLQEGLDAGLSPVAASMAKYLEVKALSYEFMNPLIDHASQSNPMVALAMFPIYSVDMAILPLSMTAMLPKKSDTLWEGEVLFLTEMDGKVEVKGNVSTFELYVHVDDESQGDMVITGEYDLKTDSLTALFSVADGTKMLFEYAAVGDGYISQWYTDQDGEHTIVRSAFDSERIYGGIITTNRMPESIYKQQIADWEGFVENDDLMIVLDQDESYLILDGHKYEN